MARVLFEGSWPACTTAENYKIWKEVAHRAIPQYGFCEDCLPEYQAKMIRCYRCEHPEAIFEKDEDGFVCGTIKKGN